MSQDFFLTHFHNSIDSYTLNTAGASTCYSCPLKSQKRHLSFFRQHGGSYIDLYNSFQTIFMRSAFTLLSFLLFTISVRAQSSSRITGKLNDEAGRAVSGASVSMLRAKDSVLVKIAVTDKEGRYEFLNMKEGSYRHFALFWFLY